MNQQDILESIKNYLQQEGILNAVIFNEDNRENESVEEITQDNLSAVLVGPTFLRISPLIKKVLPFMQFKKSSHLLSVVSTYNQFLFENKDVMVVLLKNNQLLLNKFSLKNKELFFHSKNLLGHNFSAVSYLFSNVLEKKGSLVTQKICVCCEIDLNELIDDYYIKSFNFVESALIEVLDIMKSSHPVSSFLEIDALTYNKSSSTVITVNFIGSNDSEKVNNFLTSFVGNFIKESKNHNFISFKEKIPAIISYTILQEQLTKKTDVNKQVKI